VLSELSSNELLRFCLNRRREDAWIEFMRRYQPVIAASVARIARQYGVVTRAAVEDIIQEVFVRLCDHNCKVLREFRDEREDGLYAFLKVVSANVARDRCQATAALKRGGGKVITLSAEAGSVPEAGKCEDRLELRLLMDAIEGALARAPGGASAARDRSVFWLHYRQGFTAREIAAISAFQLTAKGVESLLLRLVRHVRAELAAAGPGDRGEGSGAPKPFV